LSRDVSRRHARHFAYRGWKTRRVRGDGPLSRRSWENRRILAVCRHSAIAATSRDDPFLNRLSASPPWTPLLHKRPIWSMQQACQQVVQSITFRRGKRREGLREYLIIHGVALAQECFPSRSET